MQFFEKISHILHQQKSQVISYLLVLVTMQSITWASNADTHPGLLDKTSTHHTTEEVQAEHQAKAVIKAKAAAEKQANIKKVAQLENKAREKANNASCKANHLTDKLTIPQAKRARKEDTTVDPGTIMILGNCYFTDSYLMQRVACQRLKQTPQSKHQNPKRLKWWRPQQLSVWSIVALNWVTYWCAVATAVKPMLSKAKNIVDGKTTVFEQVKTYFLCSCWSEIQVVKSANNTTRALSVDEEVAPEPEESVDSGSDYGKSKEDPSSKDEDDIVLELENDEPDTVIKHKKGGGGKKPKKGFVAQDQINMFVGIDKNLKVEVMKRKAVTETGRCDSVYI